MPIDANELDLPEIMEKACGYIEHAGWNANIEYDYSGRYVGKDTTMGIMTSAPGTVVGWAFISAAIDNMDACDGPISTGDELNELKEIIPRNSDHRGAETIWY